MVNGNLRKYLTDIQASLIRHEYHTSEYTVFKRNEHGKEREIYKLPYFPDRVVHWAILQVIEPYIIKTLTADTFSAIPGRGIHYGVKRIKHDMRNDREGTMYCLKLDMKKYYPSINHEILKQKYARLFKDKELLWLLDEIIDSTDGDTGIPIGNYLSQYSGNLYLSSFDHWIKEQKQIKYYYRYMDDIVILHNNKAFLHNLIGEIREYCDTELKLTVKDNWQIFPTYVRGVDFLGYRFFGKYTLLRKSTCKRMKYKMSRVYNKVSNGEQMNYSEWCSISSYGGWLKHCDSYRLNEKYVKPLEPYARIYYINNIKNKR